jgi:ankyrin repeat protein
MDLFAAVTAGDLARVQELIEAHTDVNEVRGGMKETPLLLATKLPDATGAPIVRALLEAGANVDSRNLFRQTPLVSAVIGGRKPLIVIELLKKGANVNYTYRSSYYNDDDILNTAGTFIDTLLALLLAAGADIDHAHTLRAHNESRTFRQIYQRANPDPARLNFLLKFTDLANVPPQELEALIETLKSKRDFSPVALEAIAEFIREKRRDAVWKKRGPAVATWAGHYLGYDPRNNRPSAGAATGSSRRGGRRAQRRTRRQQSKRTRKGAH